MVGALFLLLGATLTAYHNSFSTPFHFDDYGTIIGNPAIASLWPPQGTTLAQRPLLHLSLAANYAVTGLRPWGYHLINLTIHSLAAVTVFAAVRRTLRLPVLQPRYGNAAEGLALAAALGWAVHPLQTQSVTYLVQRSESLMGLCYLLMFYCLIRAAARPAQTRWAALAVACCALGMASKPVMVTAPLIALCYDRIFLSTSWAQLRRQRRWLHLGLMATWVVLAACLARGPSPAKPTAGAGLAISPWAYAATQPGVILHYLKLALWPQPLCLDYGWPIARTTGAILPPTLAVGLVIAATLWALWRAPKVGFLGLWAFGILAPTSTAFPLADAAMEHRMYLPLLSVILLAVLGGHEVVARLPSSWQPLRRWCGPGLVIACAAALTMGTINRNATYRSALTMWSDVVANRPQNARGHLYLGNALDVSGRTEEAAAHFQEALRLRPDYAEAHVNLGNALMTMNRLEEAATHVEEALRIKPDFLHAHLSLGVVRLRQGRLEEAAEQLQEALRIDPDVALAHNNLGQVFFEQDRLEEAMAEYREAIRLDPRLAIAHLNSGRLLRRQGRDVEALGFLSEAVRLQPSDAAARYEYGLALAMQGVPDQALQHLTEAVRLQPGLPAAQYNLGVVLFHLRQWDLAERHIAQALQLDPGFIAARDSLEELRKRRQAE